MPSTTTCHRLTPTTAVQQAGDTSVGLKSGSHLRAAARDLRRGQSPTGTRRARLKGIRTSARISRVLGSLKCSGLAQDVWAASLAVQHLNLPDGAAGGSALCQSVPALSQPAPSLKWPTLLPVSSRMTEVGVGPHPCPAAHLVTATRTRQLLRTLQV